MPAVGNIDTSGISMFEETKKTLDRRGLKVHLNFNIILELIRYCNIWYRHTGRWKKYMSLFVEPC